MRQAPPPRTRSAGLTSASGDRTPRTAHPHRPPNPQPQGADDRNAARAAGGVHRVIEQPHFDLGREPAQRGRPLAARLMRPDIAAQRLIRRRRVHGEPLVERAEQPASESARQSGALTAERTVESGGEGVGLGRIQLEDPVGRQTHAAHASDQMNRRRERNPPGLKGMSARPPLRHGNRRRILAVGRDRPEGLGAPGTAGRVGAREQSLERGSAQSGGNSARRDAKIHDGQCEP